MQLETSSLKTTISVLTQELNSSKEKCNTITKDKEKLDEENIEISATNNYLRENLMAGEKAQNQRQKELHSTIDALSSQKHLLEEMAEQQKNAASKALVLANVIIDNFEQLLRQNDATLRQIEEEHAKNISELMQQIEIEKVESGTLTSILCEQASINGGLRVRV